MLITENGKLLEPTEPAPEEHAPVSDDPPPEYSPTPTASTSSSPQKPQGKAVNFLSLDRSNNAIKGVYVIDPNMVMPAALLAPLEPGQTEEDRKNVSLHSTNATINVDLSFVNRDSLDDKKASESGRSRPITIEMTSTNGAVRGRFNDYLPTYNRRPFSLTLASTNGTIDVALPRTFHGCVQMKSSSWNSVHFSDSFTQQVTTISDNNYFVGDLSAWSESGDASKEWQGDRLFIETSNGKVKVKFADECREDEYGGVESASSKGKSGFFRFLGF